MNWGWSGIDNGYFAPTKLAPANTGYNFSYANVGAIIGIQPPPGAVTGVSKVADVTTVKVYPNPSSGMFNVELGNVNDNPQITIYNVLGQQVYYSRLTNVQTSINLSAQSKGVYLYRVMNASGSSVSTGRLVIQ